MLTILKKAFSIQQIREMIKGLKAGSFYDACKKIGDVFLLSYISGTSAISITDSKQLTAYILLNCQLLLNSTKSITFKPQLL